MADDKDRREEEQEQTGPVVVDRRGEEREEPEASAEQLIDELSQPASDANKVALLIAFDDDEVTTFVAALLSDVTKNKFKKLTPYANAEGVADHLNAIADHFNTLDKTQREWHMKRAGFLLHQIGWYIKFRNAEAAEAMSKNGN